MVRSRASIPHTSARATYSRIIPGGKRSDWTIGRLLTPLRQRVPSRRPAGWLARLICRLYPGSAMSIHRARDVETDARCSSMPVRGIQNAGPPLSMMASSISAIWLVQGQEASVLGSRTPRRCVRSLPCRHHVREQHGSGWQRKWQTDCWRRPYDRRQQQWARAWPADAGGLRLKHGPGDPLGLRLVHCSHHSLLRRPHRFAPHHARRLAPERLDPARGHYLHIRDVRAVYLESASLSSSIYGADSCNSRPHGRWQGLQGPRHA